MSLSIEVRFQGGLSPSQQDVFESAADRWRDIITADLPPIQVRNEVIQGVVIDAQGVLIDGPGEQGRNILGQASPTLLRRDSLLPVRGMMQFDSFDLFRLEMEGQLDEVIIHEMGHVLGIGSLWRRHGLVRELGVANPVFVGLAAATEWGRLIDADGPVAVPVANMGGGGSAGVHWREGILRNELMTPSLNGGENPISSVTIASLQDMGYEVDLGAADTFPFPTPSALVALSADLEEKEMVTRCSCGSLQRPPIEPIVLPETD
ncbi:MAG: leishmanolysin-related zinc metalloendopeptidase [Alphaproteobacteria bacterium]|nr:leishmanolysin-related zinc metalloendopeptidase [Alphaproteobacteria bacterium]